eukprot:jgi/Galph1/1001/GphlegSOOS_G5814.1
MFVKHLKRSSQVVAAVSFYWLVSISLVFINKLLFSGDSFKVDAPLFITWFQCLVTVLCCYSLRGISWTGMPKFDLNLNTCIRLLPLSIIFTLMVVFNNICLKYVEVSFYQVARSLTIIFNVALDFLLLAQKTSPAAIGCCLIVVSGFWLGNREEIRWSLIGVVSGVISSFFVAMNAIYVKKMYPLVDNDPWKITLYNNMNACVLFLPCIVLNGELATLYQSENLWHYSFWIMLFVSGLLGILISFATAAQIKYTSPLTHNVSATAKAAAQTAIALMFFRNPVTGLGVTSICIVLLGSLLYSLVRRREMYVSFTTDQSFSILLVGDSGVGKTVCALLWLNCHLKLLVVSHLFKTFVWKPIALNGINILWNNSSSPTTGFHISCAVVPVRKQLQRSQVKINVEFWELGGSAIDSFAYQRILRQIPLDGLVLVYDLTIPWSRDSLWNYWSVAIHNSIGDVEGGNEDKESFSESNFHTWLQFSWWTCRSLCKLGLHCVIQSSRIFPYFNNYWKEKQERNCLRTLAQRFPVAVVGMKSDIWSQRRKLRLSKNNHPSDQIFYCQLNHNNASKDKDLLMFLWTVWEQKAKK